MIFGLIKGPEHPVAVHVQLAPVPADQVLEVLHLRPTYGTGASPWAGRAPKKGEISDRFVDPLTDELPGPARLHGRQPAPRPAGVRAEGRRCDERSPHGRTHDEKARIDDGGFAGRPGGAPRQVRRRGLGPAAGGPSPESAEARLARGGGPAPHGARHLPGKGPVLAPPPRTATRTR